MTVGGDPLALFDERSGCGTSVCGARRIDQAVDWPMRCCCGEPSRWVARRPAYVPPSVLDGIVRGSTGSGPVASVRHGGSLELGLRNVAFEVEDLQAAVDRLAADGYGLVGDIGQYEHIWRMAYVRGPEGIIVSLAQRID